MKQVAMADASEWQEFHGLHIEYDAIRDAASRIHELRVYGKTGGRQARCAFFYGPTGAGKTRCIDTYVEAENAKAKARGARIDPVRKIEVPTDCTPKALNGLILAELGTAMSSRESEAESTIRASNGIVYQGWELLILDEAQHLLRHNSPKIAFKVADHWKRLLDTAGCPILIAGLMQIEDILHENPQLRRRAAPPIRLPALGFDDPVERNTFRAILNKFDDALPFKKSAELDNMDLALRLHLATGGAIGEVSKLLYDASLIAMRKGARTLSQAHLAEVFEDYRLTGETEKVNPFTLKTLPTNSPARSLNHGMQRKSPTRRRRK